MRNFIRLWIWCPYLEVFVNIVLPWMCIRLHWFPLYILHILLMFYTLQHFCSNGDAWSLPGNNRSKIVRRRYGMVGYAPGNQLPPVRRRWHFLYEVTAGIRVICITDDVLLLYSKQSPKMYTLVNVHVHCRIPWILQFDQFWYQSKQIILQKQAKQLKLFNMEPFSNWTL